MFSGDCSVYAALVQVAGGGGSVEAVVSCCLSAFGQIVSHCQIPNFCLSG